MYYIVSHFRYKSANLFFALYLIWEINVSSMVNVVLLPLSVSNITFLGDLEAFLHSSKRPLPLLVRILHRSRIRYYGKPGQNIDFPFQVSWGHGWFSLLDTIIYLLLLHHIVSSVFQVYYEVADQSGIMSMVLWNELGPEWFHRLTVGSVLYLQQFAVKPSYQKRSRPQISNLSLMTFRSIGME